MDDDRFASGTGSASGPQKKTENARTMAGFTGGVFAREPMSGAIALTRYESALRDAACVHARDRVFVAFIDSDGSNSQSRVFAPGESIVFGRHEQARLHHSSMDVSLRHVAIAVAPSSTAEAPLIRMWDLATERPFKTEDGMVSKAVTADGPVFASVGAVHLAVIPLGVLPEKLPMGTRALWKALPARDVLSRVAGGSAVRPVPEPQERHPGRITRVTRIPSAAAPQDCAPGMAIAELCLTSDEASRTYRISLEALERGILIGRYARCLSIAGELESLSRVHLLISKIGRDVVAIDTASTFGSTRSMERAFETAVLAEHDKMLLANALLVEWRYDRLVFA
tara:strand:+ start:2604 stop:3623 length:1020 start_codon:yes stop_codon:yes gene_type:complete